MNENPSHSEQEWDEPDIVRIECKQPKKKESEKESEQRIISSLKRRKKKLSPRNLIQSWAHATVKVITVE